MAEKLGPYYFIKRDSVGAFQTDWVIINLRDSAGAAITGAVFGDVTVYFQRPEETDSIKTKTMTSGDWTEIGQGFYRLQFTATNLGVLPGAFAFLLTHASGYVVDQIWLGGANVSGAIAVVYDPNASDITFLLWLETEGQVVLHTSVVFFVIDEDGNNLAQFDPVAAGAKTPFAGYVTKVVVTNPAIAANKLYWAYAEFSIVSGGNTVTRVLHKPFMIVG